jgi:endonuclease YncB( thermonuclease family)
MHARFLRIFALSAALFSQSVAAEILYGRVVAVNDGDTITLLDAANRVFRVRLAGIDAPETNQAYGEVSKQNLERLAFGKPASVKWDRTDGYGRVVGKVVIGAIDANLAQVRAGYAWHHNKYQHEQSAEDRRRYAVSAAEARVEKLGLWRDPDPTPPWDWRTQER